MTPGEAAYTRWRELLDPRHKSPFIGLVPWNKLPIRARQIWELVAKAAIDAANVKAG